MKKYQIILVIVGGCIVGVVGLLLCFFLFVRRLPDAQVDVSGVAVDNSYNDCIMGQDLVRIGDKLYFNYGRNNHCYGLVEISEEGSRRIFWSGDHWLGTDQYNDPIRYWDDRLLVLRDDGLYSYSPGTDSFSRDAQFGQLPNVDLNIREVDGVLLCAYEGTRGDTTIYRIDEEEQTELVTMEDTVVYFTDSDIYYCKSNHLGNEDWTHEIGRYDLVNGTTTKICHLSEQYDLFTKFYVESNHVLFSSFLDEGAEGTVGIYKIDLSKDEKVPELICSGWSLYLANVYDGKVYVTGMSGLVSYDIRSNDEMKLSDRSFVMHCYIVDDTWVYFVDMKSNLWRVRQDGTGEEKVYG